MRCTKYYTIFVFTILTSLSLCAQKFSFDDLKKFNAMPLDSFKREIKEVYNYSYYDKTESDWYVLFEYDSPDYVRKIGKFDYKDTASNCIEYSTKDENEFALFKSNLTKLGYKLTTTAKKYGNTFSDYKKGNQIVRLSIPKDTASKNEYYDIIIFK